MSDYIDQGLRKLSQITKSWGITPTPTDYLDTKDRKLNFYNLRGSVRLRAGLVRTQSEIEELRKKVNSTYV